jgi:FMN reductase
MAVALVVDELRLNPRVMVDVIDPGSLALRMPGIPGGEEAARQLRDRVSQASGVVLATPEYHGSFSSVIKLVVENLGFPSALAGKPVALLGVAAGAIGAIKSLEHLRSVVSHVGGIALPLPVSVAHVQKVFDESGNCLDSAMEKRVRGSATSMMEYLEQNVCPRITLERMMREG